jgi:hypothetical protein
MIAKTYFSASLVRPARNMLSDGLPICFAIELCYGPGKKEIFIGRPGATGNPFSHSAQAIRERRVPERQLKVVPYLPANSQTVNG